MLLDKTFSNDKDNIFNLFLIFILPYQCDSDEITKKGALEVFPVLLHHLGPNANHLVYDLIQ